MIGKSALLLTVCTVGLAATLMIVPAHASAPSVESSTNGAIGVLVMDRTDRRIEGAKVWAESHTTGAKTEILITGRDGTVFFADVKPGAYTVIAEKDEVGVGKARVKVMRYRKSRVKVVLTR